jgi:hypothetical protein
VVDSVSFSVRTCVEYLTSWLHQCRLVKKKHVEGVKPYELLIIHFSCTCGNGMHGIEYPCYFQVCW